MSKVAKSARFAILENKFPVAYTRAQKKTNKTKTIKKMHIERCVEPFN